MSEVRKGTESGLPFVILKHDEMGHLCGYVGVPCEHPWYKIHYNQCLEGCEGEPNQIAPNRMTSWHCTWKESHNCPEKQIEVHGGLSYSNIGDDDYLPKDFWWFGFDCAHAGDLIPKFSIYPSDTYRDEKYVEEECRKLAKQLAKIVKTVSSEKLMSKPPREKDVEK